MASYQLAGNFHLFVSPTFYFLKNGAVVFNGTYSLRYIPSTPHPEPA